jgi:hypothetical protein
MSRFTDAELYRRGSDTLLASWEAYVCGAVGAAALAYDLGDDCGIYNVGTVERAARPRACSRPRWPSTCTPPWVSATSAGSSNTSPRKESDDE